jgi:hypothetical protein
MRGDIMIICTRPESVKTVLIFLPVREGSVRRSDFGITGILFSHDIIIMLKKISAEIAELILNFDDSLFIKESDILDFQITVKKRNL